MKRLILGLIKKPMPLFMYSIGIIFFIVLNIAETAYFGLVSIPGLLSDIIIVVLILAWEVIFIIGNCQSFKKLFAGMFLTIGMCSLDYYIFLLITHRR